jgi:hypothetical protein
LIQISLIDSWAATSAGAFSLSENNLYTIEAYQLYWRRLSDRGVISTSRWMRGPMGVEMIRLINLARESIRREGVSVPNRHLAVVGAGGAGTLVVARQPLDRRMVIKLRKICQDRGFILYFPTTAAVDARTDIAEIVAAGDKGLDTGLDLSPPTDDRPFFFQVLPVFRPTSSTTARNLGINGDAVYALQVLMIYMFICTFFLFFSPFVLRRWMRRSRAFWRGTSYFASIGLAFMLVEIAWLQRFILFLGHPSVATTVVLGSILLGAGTGSMMSTRFGLARLQRYGFIVALIIGIMNAALPHLFQQILGSHMAVRILVSIILVAPIGYFLGMFLPLGMVFFGDQNRAWFWAINGACSVMASVLSLALAMTYGFTLVACVGAFFYLLAWLLLRVSRATPQDI